METPSWGNLSEDLKDMEGQKTEDYESIREPARRPNHSYDILIEKEEQRKSKGGKHSWKYSRKFSSPEGQEFTEGKCQPGEGRQTHPRVQCCETAQQWEEIRSYELPKRPQKSGGNRKRQLLVSPQLLRWSSTFKIVKKKDFQSRLLLTAKLLIKWAGKIRTLSDK